LIHWIQHFVLFMFFEKCETDWEWQLTQFHFFELIFVFRILECHAFFKKKTKDK
jgi:hypothetical protein